MRFVDFVDAVRSAWGAAENATVVLAILAGAGLSATFGTVPTLAAMAACLVFNALSTLLPAWMATRRSIAYTLTGGE